MLWHEYRTPQAPPDFAKARRAHLFLLWISFQNSLTNHAKTLMICNVAPKASQLAETLNTLRFAGSVAQVTTTK
jgi:hypothetical protein